MKSFLRSIGIIICIGMLVISLIVPIAGAVILLIVTTFYLDEIGWNGAEQIPVILLISGGQIYISWNIVNYLFK